MNSQQNPIIIIDFEIDNCATIKDPQEAYVVKCLLNI